MYCVFILTGFLIPLKVRGSHNFCLFESVHENKRAIFLKGCGLLAVLIYTAAVHLQWLIPIALFWLQMLQKLMTRLCCTSLVCLPSSHADHHPIRLQRQPTGFPTEWPVQGQRVRSWEPQFRHLARHDYWRRQRSTGHLRSWTFQRRRHGSRFFQHHWIFR